MGKDDVITAAMNGNIELVKDHVLADAGCVLEADSEYVCPFRARAAGAHDFTNRVHAAVPFNFSNFCYQWFHRVDVLLISRIS